MKTVSEWSMMYNYMLTHFAQSNIAARSAANEFSSELNE